MKVSYIDFDNRIFLVIGFGWVDKLRKFQFEPNLHFSKNDAPIWTLSIHIDQSKKQQHLWKKLPCFPATMTQLYSNHIQLCQNCPVYVSVRCPGTVVPGAVTSEGCYNHLVTSSDVQMVSFDNLGLCQAYNTSACMEPYNVSHHGSWSARLANATGNPI